MIFQEPMTSLDPLFTVGNQIMEAILYHQDVSKAEARKLALEMLDKVRMPQPARRHQTAIRISYPAACVSAS